MDFFELKKILKQDLSCLPELRMALLGDSATQLLAVALRGMAATRGFRLTLWEADYDQIAQQVSDPQSELNGSKSQYVVVFQSVQKLWEEYNKAADKSRVAADRLRFVERLTEQVRGRIIYMNYPEWDDGVWGSFANKTSESFLYQTRLLNVGLMQLAERRQNLSICDLQVLQNELGRERLQTAAQYVLTEMALSLDVLPQVVRRVMDIVCAAEGKMHKCLVVDLDNTLWGGVVAEDGYERLQMSHSLGIGRAYHAVQQWIKNLKERGVIIAVCSKNDEQTAKEVFEKSGEMVLRLDDFSMFVANYDNKADNIRLIQRTLQIGLDSMVFLDDNRFERELVRQALPEVTVPELDDDPALWVEQLAALNLFETAAVTQEDRQRTQQYQQQAARAEKERQFVDYEDYLRSLKMLSKVERLNDYNLPRAAQLTQRSNQFNLRTVRYTADELQALQQDERYHTFCFSLRDCYGDDGLVSVVILRETDVDTLFIDTWLMSCRVLKRGMEQFVLNTIVRYAREQGYQFLAGEYIPTKKNQMVEMLLPEMGFLPTERARQYILNMTDYQTKICYIDEDKG